MLTPLLPLPPGSPQPPAGLLPLFVVLVLIESVSFGLGVAFLIFGRGLLGSVGRSPRLTTAAYIAIAFLLVNWWPHDYMHRLASGDWDRVVLVEYGFHIPLMVAGALLGWFFVSLPGTKTAPIDGARTYTASRAGCLSGLELRPNPPSPTRSRSNLGAQSWPVVRQTSPTRRSARRAARGRSVQINIAPE